MAEDGEAGGGGRRCCRLASPLEDDDLLAIILLRLPPRPSSLPRASLVCKRWRRVASDPYILGRVAAHHRRPPLLGFFSTDRMLSGNIYFTPTLDPPDRIPLARFFLRLDEGSRILGCRHGRVLLVDRGLLVVWAPVTGDHRCVAVPPPFRGMERFLNGAVVCAAGDQGHVHGVCHSSPFQVVLVGSGKERIFARVYSSETGTWGNISILQGNVLEVTTDRPSTLVGNSIYWLLKGWRRYAILEFDLERQNLAVIDVPDALGQHEFLITPADSGGLGFLVLSGLTARLWKREANCDGVSGWVLRNTVELRSLLSLGQQSSEERSQTIMGLVEDDNMLLLLIDSDVFMVHLESMQFEKLSGKRDHCLCHPFTSFYPADDESSVVKAKLMPPTPRPRPDGYYAHPPTLASCLLNSSIWLEPYYDEL
ncbi:hypothetical protein ACP70R_012087 [Stipagrostis hirtigluma subsp. patula]